MNCPDCGGRMGVYALDTCHSRADKIRRWRCRDCGHKIKHHVPLDDRLAADRTGVRTFSPEQVEWVLTTAASGEHCARVLQCSGTTICKIRRRETYRDIRPDLPRWHRKAPWLVPCDPPPERARPPRVQHCFECLHFGGLSLPCTIHNPPLPAATCPEFTPDDDDDDDDA